MNETILNIETQERSCLSGDAILRMLRAGRIFIMPFNRRNMGTSQYDARLGSYYYREAVNQGEPQLFNIFSKEHIDRVWGAQWHEAERHADWAGRENHGELLENVGRDERIILLEPGETVLAHTLEFIGGNDNRITTKMQARSSMGRSFIEICKCAGMGDIGYCNRWTMEITNNSQSQRIPLVAGMRVAQLVFFETEGVSEKLFADYSATRKYQSSQNLVEMVRSWHPEMMKPKLYKDWELRDGKGYRHFAKLHNEEIDEFLRTGRVAYKGIE